MCAAGPRHYFCGVLQTLDALDEDASTLRIKVGDYLDGKLCKLASGENLVFRKEVVGSAHVFRTSCSETAFCDRVLRDALKAADMEGITLRTAAPCRKKLESNHQASPDRCTHSRVPLVVLQIRQHVKYRYLQGREIVMTSETPIPATVAGVSRKGKFFVIEPSLWGGGRGPGIEVANEEALWPPGMNTMDPPNGDAGQYPQKPHLVHVPELGDMPRDFEELAGIWIVSEALKHVFESVDAEGFAFAACDFTLADGSPGPQYFLCDVVRSLDALDESASRVKVRYEHDHETGEDLKFYSVAGGASLAFDESVVSGAHVFRQVRIGLEPVCDRVLFDALSAAGLNGVRLRDAADL
ncbi:MAG: imm11 family protein [Lysobacteraceae bacterium]